MGAGADPWMKRPPIVGLYHELVHAYNAATGSMQPGVTTGGVELVELQAVGLTFTGIAWDNDGNPSTAAALGQHQGVHRERAPRLPGPAGTHALLTLLPNPAHRLWPTRPEIGRAARCRT